MILRMILALPIIKSPRPATLFLCCAVHIRNLGNATNAVAELVLRMIFSLVAIWLNYHLDQNQPWVVSYCITRNVVQ